MTADDATVALDAILDGALEAGTEAVAKRALIRAVLGQAISEMRAEHPRTARVRHFKPRSWTGRDGLFYEQHVWRAPFMGERRSENHYRCLFCGENLHTHGEGPRISVQVQTRMLKHTCECACRYLMSKTAP